MKKQSDMTSLTPKTDITVFQALTLLLDKYHDDPDIYKKIELIYLTGVRSERAEGMLNDLLDDPLLDAYIINTSKQAINDDPVRRYFESHLCHNTLATSLDLLDVDLLDKHLSSIINRIHKDDQAFILPLLHDYTSKPRMTKFSDEIAKLSKSSSFQSLKPTETLGRETPDDILGLRKKKLTLLSKSMRASKYAEKLLPSGKKLCNFYERPDSPYDNNNRGRILRMDLDQNDEIGIYQTVCPHTLGIMRSYMPLPINDALRAEEASNFPRPADSYTYAQGSYRVADQIFSNKVTPLVSSISGNMLTTLSVLVELLQEQKLVFITYDDSSMQNNEQFDLFMKTFIAYMIYYAGGHSLNEYFMVLDLPVVQREFQSLKGFSDLTLMNLFQEGNLGAFNKTVKQTITYNDNILLKKKLHFELETRHKVNIIVHQSNRAHPATVGTIRFNRPGTDASYTVIDSSIIGGALLFALIRLLDNKSVPANRKNDLSPRFKQLCFVLCMVTVAHAFGTKITKQEKIQKHQNNPKKSLSAGLSLATKHVLDYSIFKEPKNIEPATPPRQKYTASHTSNMH